MAQQKLDDSFRTREFFREEGITDSRGFLAGPYASAIHENCGFYSKIHRQSQI
jgi:hypothetical protein